MFLQVPKSEQQLREEDYNVHSSKSDLDILKCTGLIKKLACAGQGLSAIESQGPEKTIINKISINSCKAPDLIARSHVSAEAQAAAMAVGPILHTSGVTHKWIVTSRVVDEWRGGFHARAESRSSTRAKSYSTLELYRSGGEARIRSPSPSRGRRPEHAFTKRQSWSFAMCKTRRRGPISVMNAGVRLPQNQNYYKLDNDWYNCISSEDNRLEESRRASSEDLNRWPSPRVYLELMVWIPL